MQPLSIVILSRNDQNFAACATAVRRAAPSARIILIDDGLVSSGATLRARFGPLVILPGAKPFVFAANANIGIRAAEEDDVLLLNDDAQLLAPGDHAAWFERMGGPIEALLNASARRPEFGVVSCAVRGPSNSGEHAPVAYPRNLEQTAGAWDLLSIRPFRGKTVPFIAVLIPRRAIDLVGLLDERFTDYGGDDDDYCYRVRQAGLGLGIYDGCVVDHGSLQSTFRPHGGGRDISTARAQFRAKHGFEMATR